MYHSCAIFPGIQLQREVFHAPIIVSPVTGYFVMFLYGNSSLVGWIDESFLTVFQSYEENVRVIMKGCMQWNLVYSWKDFCLKQGSNPGPLDQ